jgi:transposase-like protein
MVLARSGTRVAQLAETFGMSEACIYGWLNQERLDRGEAPGLSTEGQLELAAAKGRIRLLDCTGRFAEGQRGLPRAERTPKASSL